VHYVQGAEKEMDTFCTVNLNFNLIRQSEADCFFLCEPSRCAIILSGILLPSKNTIYIYILYIYIYIYIYQ